MLPPLTTLTVFVILAPGAGAFAAVAPQGDPPKAAPTAPATTPASAADNDAAAKHAKLTACLKEAKAKKLVGEQKSAFIKECVAGS